MKKINKRTQEIIDLLIQGKTQWEVHKMGYPFGTVRYHYQKMFKPKQFKKFMTVHKERMKKKWRIYKENAEKKEEAKQKLLRAKKRKLSTSKAKK